MKWQWSILLEALRNGLKYLLRRGPLKLVLLHGSGMWLEVQLRSDAPASHESLEDGAMGKFASYMKRGSAGGIGTMAAPGPAPTDFTAVTGGAGVITVTRVAAIPVGATAMLFRALDTTTNLITFPYNPTLSGMVSGRTYRVQAAWFNGVQQVSDASPAIAVAAG